MIARLSKGDIFGEMSLPGELSVSANVVVDSRVQVQICDLQALNELFAEHTTLETSFYKSLSFVPSTRLRDTTLRSFG